jgi:hypothetical protein
MATYWYYKLHANQPIFPTQQPNKLSKYKHLGKAGSQAHIHAVSPLLEEPKSITYNHVLILFDKTGLTYTTVLKRKSKFNYKNFT